mgnify:CR=1 FL=1
MAAAPCRMALRRQARVVTADRSVCPLQEAADIVWRCADKLGLQPTAELLTATSIRKGSMDNTSAVVVDLRGHRVGGCLR